jgi:hypothetical protein
MPRLRPEAHRRPKQGTPQKQRRPTVNSVTQERDQRVAIHEGGHVVAGFLLGERPGPVTIVERPAYGGAACHRALPYLKSDLERTFDHDGMFDKPLPLMPARLHRSIEVRIMILLAGPLTVDAYWPTSGYAAPSLDEEAATELVERVTPPTRKDRERLEHDADVPYTEDKSDDARAFKLAHALVDDLVAAYLNLLRAATVQLISTPKFSEGMDAIVPALLEHKTLSARTGRALLNGKES